MSAPRSPARKKALWGIGAVLMVLAVAWPILNSHREGPTAQELDMGRRTALGIVGGMVHDYYSRNGRFPDQLSDVMRGDDLGVRYRRLEDGFELSTTMPDGTTLAVKQR